MSRPRGRIKTKRITINLDDRVYGALLAIADLEDVPIGQIARRAVVDYLKRKEPVLQQPVLPVAYTTPAKGKQ